MQRGGGQRRSRRHVQRALRRQAAQRAAASADQGGVAAYRAVIQLQVATGRQRGVATHQCGDHRHVTAAVQRGVATHVQRIHRHHRASACRGIADHCQRADGAAAGAGQGGIAAHHSRIGIQVSCRCHRQIATTSNVACLQRNSIYDRIRTRDQLVGDQIARAGQNEISRRGIQRADVCAIREAQVNAASGAAHQRQPPNIHDDRIADQAYSVARQHLRADIGTSGDVHHRIAIATNGASCIQIKLVARFTPADGESANGNILAGANRHDLASGEAAPGPHSVVTGINQHLRTRFHYCPGSNMGSLH